MAVSLEQERQQIEEERHKLLVMQNTAREQAELRQKTVQDRLRYRWRVRSITITLGMVILLVTLQFLFLNLAHIKIAAQISFLLLLPIVVCSLLALVLSGPLSRVRDICHGAPHKKKVKRD
jgi:Mn2+/Fe2+ NRAMP family transporter